MLKEARRKSEAEGLKIRWVEGDMRQFELGQKFGLIILAGNTICHLLDVTSVESCFRCVRQHLEMDGRFIVNVFVPSQALLKRRCDEPEPFAEYASPDGDGMVVVTHTYEYEPDTQIKRIITHHRFPNRSSIEYGSLNMRMFYPQELDALLRYNGFRIIHKWSNELKEAFGPDSGQQVVVCKMAT
jgi:SAM-dependent methyltransferase